MRTLKIFLIIVIMVLIGGGICIGREEEAEKKEEKKNYLKAGLGTFAVNAVVWTYDWHIQRKGWANISVDSIIRNFKKSFIWDNNSFQCNQIEHPLQGAMFASAAWVNKLSFGEGIIFSFLGSLMWEFMLENHRPSTNDQIMTGFGGPLPGRSLFIIANDLVIDESSSGLERVLRETLALVVNPVIGVDRLITGKSFKIGSRPEKHYYDLELPIGIYRKNLMFKVGLEYKDAIEKEIQKISPYDYFTFDFKLGFDKKGLRDKEVLTTGVLFGKKTNKGLFGVFGQFDYIDYAVDHANNIIGKMSIIGVGPGLVANFKLGPDSYFNVFGVISGGFAGSTSSFTLKYGKDFFTKQGEKYEFERDGNSYHLGPGLSAKLSLELEKQNLGSAKFQFSQYWVSSIFIDTDEWLSILSLDLKLNLIRNIQLNTGIDYYLRNAFYKDFHLARGKVALRNSLVFKF